MGVVLTIVQQGMIMAFRTRWFLAERFVLLNLKSCNRLCNHLPLGADLVKESLVLDEQEQDGGGAIDKAHISLSNQPDSHHRASEV